MNPGPVADHCDSLELASGHLCTSLVAIHTLLDIALVLDGNVLSTELAGCTWRKGFDALTMPSGRL